MIAEIAIAIAKMIVEYVKHATRIQENVYLIQHATARAEAGA